MFEGFLYGCGFWLACVLIVVVPKAILMRPDDSNAKSLELMQERNRLDSEKVKVMRQVSSLLTDISAHQKVD